MHELSYITRIIPLAVEAAGENRITNVREVSIAVGEMTGAVPELLGKAYRESTPGTLLENSDLVVTMVPVTAVCDECENNYHPSKENDYCCPSCGSKKSRIISGREVTLVSIKEM